MPYNFEGNSRPLNAVTQLSLHTTNPGTGASPTVGSELTDAPYARQSCVFNAPVANGTAAESLLNADVTFNLNLTIDQNVQFVGLWADTTYLGYVVPGNPFNFTGEATTRRFVATVTNTKLVRDNL
jgi:hypothetical protein